jgi:hypothetical protein
MMRTIHLTMSSSDRAMSIADRTHRVIGNGLASAIAASVDRPPQIAIHYSIHTKHPLPD